MMRDNIVLSIVLPTLGRIKEVDAMLESIHKYVASTPITFEVIVVDQNFSNALDEVITKYKDIGFDISQHKVSFRGLSKAKNYGAKFARGKYVCNIDDDAEFLEGTVERAIKRLEVGEFDIVSGRCIDRDGNDSTLKFEHKEQVLSLQCFENRFIESTMFFKREICERFQYDEEMGLGAFYGAEEGYDLVYRMLKEKVNILFDPEITFYHPQNFVSRSQPGIARKTFSYKIGFGYLCKKHHLRKKYWKRLLSVMCYIPYLSIVRPKDVKFYFGEMLGMLAGRFL